MATWREAVEAAARRQAARDAGGVFTRAAMRDEELPRIVAELDSAGTTPAQTMSRVLQEMRADGVIEFLDDQGTYRLTG